MHWILIIHVLVICSDGSGACILDEEHVERSNAICTAKASALIEQQFMTGACELRPDPDPEVMTK